MSQAFDRIVARPNNTDPDYMRFKDGTTLTLDPDSAAFLLVDLAKWLSRQNVILGVGATMEATSQVFEALGNPGVSQEITAAVNEILAKNQKDTSQ